MHEFIYAFVVSFIGLYGVWKFTNRHNLLSSVWFDIAISSTIASLLISRLAHLVLYWSTNQNTVWSWFPYYTEVTKRVWLEHFPWQYLKLYEGLSIPIGVTILILILFLQMSFRIKQKKWFDYGVIVVYLYILNAGYLFFKLYKYWQDDNSLNFGLASIVIIEVLITVGIMLVYYSKKVKFDKDFMYRLALGVAFLGIIGILGRFKTTLNYHETTISFVSGVLVLCLGIMIFYRDQIGNILVSKNVRKTDLTKDRLMKVSQFLTQSTNTSNDTKPGFMLSYRYMRQKDSIIKRVVGFVVTTYYKFIKQRNTDEINSRKRK